MKPHNLLKGSSFIIISGFFYATYGIWPKFMAGSFGEFSQAWIRGIILLILLIPFGILTRQFKKIDKNDIGWFIFISLCGGLNQAPYFYGFAHLSVGTATLLFYLMIIVGTIVLGKFFFHEKLTNIKYIAFLLAGIGLLIIYQFVLVSSQFFPALVCMIAGFMGATFITFSKKVSFRYSEVHIITVLLLFVVICNLLLSFVFGNKIPSFSHEIAWVAQFGYTGAYLLANTIAVAGFKYLEPSVAGLLGLLEIVFGALLGMVVFHEVISLQFIIGSIFIIAAAALPDIATLMKRS